MPHFPTQQGHKQQKKEKKTWCPARACGCVYVQEACLEKRQKQMPVGSQQGCRHWPHFHPNVNTRKCLAPKQTRYTCWGNFSNDSSLVDLRYQKYTNTQRPACWTEIRRLKALTIRVPSRVTSITRCPVAQAEQKDGYGSAKLWVLNVMSSALNFCWSYELVQSK